MLFKRNSKNTENMRKETKLRTNNFKTILTFFKVKSNSISLIKFCQKCKKSWVKLYMQWLIQKNNTNWIQIIVNIAFNFMDMILWSMKILYLGSSKSIQIHACKLVVKSFNQLFRQCYKMSWKFVLIQPFLHQNLKIGL